MYPQQPGQQPQGPTPPPAPPQQSGQPQPYPYPVQPAQQSPQAPVAPVDPWQLQQPHTPPAAPPQQPVPQPAPSPWQQTGTYHDQAAPLTPDGMAPIDYLNQIAPQQKKSFGFSRKHLAIFGGLVLLGFIAFAVVAILQGGKPSITALSNQVLTRVGATSTIAKDSKKNLQSRDLDALNSSLAIQLTNTQTGLAEAFTAAGVVVGEAKNIKADDTSAETTQKLDDARLNGIFDRVYAREMSFRLATIMAQLDSIHRSTSNADLRDYLEETYKNLEPLQKQLEDYSATTSWRPVILLPSYS